MVHRSRGPLATTRGKLAAVGLSVLMVAAACSRSEDVSDDADAGEDGDALATQDAGGEGDDTDDTDDTSNDEGGEDGDAGAEPVQGGALTVGGESEVGQPWTPANVRCDSACYQRALTFYDTLTVIDENGEWQPFLAESMEPNDDYTEWTVTLREGITFHDGEPFNADAAIFNLNQHAQSLLTAEALGDIARDPQNEDQFALEKVDEYTFTIQTGYNGDIDEPLPWPGLPYGFTKQAGFMASPAWLRDAANGGDPTAAVGTGPFELESFRPDDRMRVVRNDDYWMTDDDGNQLPYLDEIEFVVIPDAQARQAAIEGGEVDMVAEAEGNIIGDLQENDELVTEQQAEYTETSHIMLHAGKENSPLNSQEVRCALLQGLDRETLADQRAGVHPRADGLFSEGQQGHLEDNGLPDYDPDAASEAIEAYEQENGDIEIIYSTTSTTATQRQAEFVSEQWQAIGVDVDIQTVEQAELITNAATGAETFDAFGWRNHGGLFVEQQYYWWHTRNANTEPIALNFGRIRDDVIDENLETARSTTDDAEADEAAEEINRRFAEQCYVIPTWHVEWGVSRAPGIDGLERLQVPDGDTTIADGAGFPGQVWFTTIFMNG